MENYGIEYDEAKRLKTLEERGIDFNDAAAVFAGKTFDREDNRHDYGEVRIVTVGHLCDRMVVVVWTHRGDNRRIISMRYTHESERKVYVDKLE